MLGRWHWHKEAHVNWGRERLFFWRLSFGPTYEREKVLAALDSIVEQSRICSFAVYELFGETDLLLRAWLPVQTTQEHFEDRLRKELPRLTQLSVFSVTSNLLHWVWQPNGDFERPSEARILSRPPDDEIETINNFDEANNDLLRRYAEDRLIAEATHTRGIKFVVFVTISPVGGYVDHFSDMRDRLVGILERARSVEEKSLYEGLGFARFLVLGRVDFNLFERIRTEVTDPITRELSPGTFGGRTYTMLVPAGDFLRFEERLPVNHPAPRVLTAQEALETEEAEAVEVKASAFHKADVWAKTGKIIEDRELAVDAIARSIVALLNTVGGTVVIGAFETKHLPGDAERVGKLPRVGEYTLFGLERDYQGKDWDAYERRLSQLISSHIEPDPLLWVSIEPQEVKGTRLARIAVRQPDRDWYFLTKGGKDFGFYIRVGGRSEKLEGPIMDAYRRARPRLADRER